MSEVKKLPPLKYLRTEQYDSWLRKISDPDWYEHRYRDAKDRAMVSAMRELVDVQKCNAALYAALYAIVCDEGDGINLVTNGLAALKLARGDAQ